MVAATRLTPLGVAHYLAQGFRVPPGTYDTTPWSNDTFQNVMWALGGISTLGNDSRAKIIRELEHLGLRPAANDNGKSSDNGKSNEVYAPKARFAEAASITGVGDEAWRCRLEQQRQMEQALLDERLARDKAAGDRVKNDHTKLEEAARQFQRDFERPVAPKARRPDLTPAAVYKINDAAIQKTVAEFGLQVGVNLISYKITEYDKDRFMVRSMYRIGSKGQGFDLSTSLGSLAADRLLMAIKNTPIDVVGFGFENMNSIEVARETPHFFTFTFVQHFLGREFI